MSLESYTDPVAQLIACGQASLNPGEDWLNYPEQFGLTLADVPELIRMAQDTQFDEMDPEAAAIWAPVHAVRALGQLRAEAAIAPLLTLLLEDDDYFHNNVPLALGKIGEAAIAPTLAFIHEEEQDDLAPGYAISVFGYIGETHPESRDAAIDALVSLLENPGDRLPTLLTYAVAELIDLKATEVAPQIEQAFATNQLDEWIVGNWPLAQIEMGLKQESDFTPEELHVETPPLIQEITDMLKLLERQENTPQGFGPPPSPKKQKKKKKK